MAEKTEQPTPKKLRDAREKGNLLFSKEVVSIATLTAVVGSLMIGFPIVLQSQSAMLQVTFESMGEGLLYGGGRILTAIWYYFAITTALVYGFGIFSAILFNMLQIGVYFSFSKLTKGLESINFINNAKNMFSKKSFYGFLLNIFKTVLIIGALLLVYNMKIGDFLLAPQCGIGCVIQNGMIAMVLFLIIVILMFVPLAVIDYLMQRHFYLKELKMSIEEVKQELKDTEGSPEIKGRRREIHKEVLNEQTTNRVKDSTVVVKNPTHYAVALIYEEDLTPLPVVVAKGEGTYAHIILEEARIHEVPVYENIELAQRLFFEAELDAYIPKDFFEAIAEVLRYVEDLQRQ